MQSLSQINKNVEIIKKLIKLNSKNFYYNNLNYFPLIKLAIFSNRNLNNKKKNKIKKNKFFSICKFILNLPFFLINRFFYIKYLKKKLKKTDVVFFSDINFYYDKYKNKKINSFIDPYFKFISEHRHSTKLEVVPHWYKEKNDKLISPIYLKFLYLDLYKFIIFNVKDYFLFKEEKFYKYIKLLLKQHKIKLNSDEFKKKYDKIYFHSKVVEKILKKINPKIVFLTCYYNDISLSILLACKRLNIKSVDIQHGGFEPAHLMYKYWQKSEFNKGYKLLPNFFWVWDKKYLIDKFYFQNKNHRVIEGGKLLIQNIEETIKNVQKNLSNEDKYFIKSLKRYKRRILFCATSNVPDCLIKSIKITQKNKNWIWMIRLHPRHSNYKKLKEKLLKEKISLKNIKIDKPSKLNLYFIIDKSSHVLIDQSSVVLDAAYQKKPVICLNNQKNIFSSWNKLNVCDFTNNPLKIINLIKNVSKNKCSNTINYKVRDYIGLNKKIFN